MSELDATKPSDVDWGYLTELFRETEKPIRKDENVFYEFSSAMFANFKHILAEREQMRAKLEAAQRLRNGMALVGGLTCPQEMRECIDERIAAFDKEQS